MMKKVLVFLVLLVASTFFSVSVFADNLFQQPMAPYETLTITLSSGYYNVALDPGEAYRFNWSVSNLNSNNIYIDSISTVSAGSSDPQIYGTAVVDVSSSNGGWASFINTSDQTISGLDLSVSVTCTLYNSNDSYQTPRASLSCTNGSSFSTSYVSNAALNSKLNQILSTLGESTTNYFFGDDALVYFAPPYFNQLTVPSQTSTIDDNGFFNITGDNPEKNFSIYNRSGSAYSMVISLTPGVYQCSLVLPGDISSVTIGDISHTVLSSSYRSGVNYTYISIIFETDQLFSSYRMTFRYEGTLTSGIVYGALRRATSEDYADSAMNPNQDQMVDDVDKAGEDQAAQEEQMWSNINTYKGSLDFSLDGWDDASSGLSYVRDVFMIIWDNSPTEIITLSLMLGIAMLSIGRGVGAAVRASSRRRGDD